MAMMRSKSATIILAFSCLILVACTEGGILMPIPQENSELLSTWYKEDTIRRTQRAIELTTHGRWGSLGWVTIDLEISSKNNERITVDLKALELTNNFTGEVRYLGASQQVTENRYQTITEERATINGHEKKTLALYFKVLPPEGSPLNKAASKPLVQKTVKLAVPVILNQGEGTPIKADFVFQFKYANRSSFENIGGTRLRLQWE